MADAILGALDRLVLIWQALRHGHRPAFTGHAQVPPSGRLLVIAKFQPCCFPECWPEAQVEVLGRYPEGFAGLRYDLPDTGGRRDRADPGRAGAQPRCSSF